MEIKNVKKIQIRKSRFNYESESEYYSSCKNHESDSEYSGFGEKDSNPNPNPNIRYNTALNAISSGSNHGLSMVDDDYKEEADQKMIPDQALLSPAVSPGLGHQHDKNKCQPNKTFIWCLPVDYNQEKHPFTCRCLWREDR